MIKRIALFSVLLSLIISSAAPTGAVFAFKEAQSMPVEVADTPEIDDAITVSADEGVTPVSEIGNASSVDVHQEVAIAARVDESVIIEETESFEETSLVDDVALTEVVPLKLQEKQLVISYVQTSGIYGKYVEIVNVSDGDYSTKQLSLQFVRNSDTNGNSPDLLASFYGTIPAGGRVTIGNTVIEQSVDQDADSYFSQTASAVMSPNGGWLLLVDGTVELDSFCWATNGLCGDDFYSPLPMSQGMGYGRCFDDSGKPQECTQNNWYEATPLRRATVGGGFVPFYNSCTTIEVSEVAPSLLDQFIEIYNTADQKVLLEGCILQLNTRMYQFSFGEEIGAHEYRVINPAHINVTLARTTPGEVRLLSSSGEIVDWLKYTTPQMDRSVMRDDQGNAVWTFRPTPGVANEYLQYLPCEEGYWRNEETGRCNKVAEPVTATDCGEGRERNPDTGRCRNIPSIPQLAPCKEGQYRSEETNRCRSIATAAAAVLKSCADDQFRNPETNRCKKIASSDDVALADCGEGRERNPATNRCRNVLGASTLADTLPFPVEETAEGAARFAGWWTLGIIAALGLGYGAWEWRYEIAGLSGRVFGKIKK